MEIRSPLPFLIEELLDSAITLFINKIEGSVKSDNHSRPCDNLERLPFYTESDNTIGFNIVK